MTKVTVLGLSGCSWCDSVRTLLYDEDIKYSFVDVNKSGRIADFVEDLLEVEVYPIIILQKGRDMTYIYRAEESKQLGKHPTKDNSTKIGVLTAFDFISAIKNELK